VDGKGGGRGITYANDALGTNQLDQLVRDVALCVTLAVCLEVAQVTDVALVVAGGAVRLVVWVDCARVSFWAPFPLRGMVL
jgi:hypothetical protein